MKVIMPIKTPVVEPRRFLCSILTWNSNPCLIQPCQGAHTSFNEIHSIAKKEHILLVSMKYVHIKIKVVWRKLWRKKICSSMCSFLARLCISLNLVCAPWQGWIKHRLEFQVRMERRTLLGSTTGVLIGITFIFQKFFFESKFSTVNFQKFVSQKYFFL